MKKERLEVGDIVEENSEPIIKFKTSKEKREDARKCYPLKQLPNGILEDSNGRKYWIDENGSIRRVK